MNSSYRRCVLPYAWLLVVMTLVVLSFPGVAGADVTFSTSSYSTASGPYGIDVGNFDNDSDLDIVTANMGNTSVSVLLNNGNGTFATKSDYATASSPRSVAVGDFDEDGYIDLAVASNVGDCVSILLNDGDGTYGTKTDYSTGEEPFSIAVEDFDKDGNLDVVVARTSGNKVEILTGNGDGTFDTGLEYSIANVSFSVATGYFDSGTYPDLAAGNGFSANVSVLLNDGDGTFATKVNYTVDDTSFAVATGDFDEDGYDDIVVTNHETDVVSILINDGDGTFGSNTDYAVGDTPQGVTVGDFNGDDHLDIAATNYEDNDVSVLLGDGDGDFGTKTDYAVGSYPYGIVSGDFNGDSKTDLAVANSYGSSVSVMLNTTVINTAPTVDAGLDDTVTYPANATLDATVTDDDLPDPPATVTTTWTKQSGPGTVTFGNASAVDTTAAFSTSGTYVLRLTADDSDLDDYDEVTITVNAAPTVNAGLDDTVTYPANATLDATVSDDGLPSTPGTVTTTWTKQSGAGTVTFDNASSVDTTAAFSASGTYVLRLTADDGDATDYDEVTITVNATPTVEAGSNQTITYPSSATLDGNVNDDGLPNPPGTYTVLWTKQSGPGTVTFDDDDAVDTTASFSVSGTYVLRLTADDSDATDYDEVTITVNTTPSVNAGLDDSVTYPSSATLDATVSDDGLPNPPGSVTTTWTKQSGPGTVTFGNASAVDTTAGFDTAGSYVLRLTANDGSAEAFDEVEITVDESSGSPSSVTFSVSSYSTGSAPCAVDAGNFDNDSDVDLVTANMSGTSVSVLLNNGDGTFATKSDYATASSPRSVAVGDFDEDGYIDLAVASNVGDCVSILLNDGDGTYGTKTDYSTGEEPYSIAVEDFDKDGNLDVVVARTSGNKVEVLTGNGDGTFDTGVEYSIANVSFSVATGYFDSGTYPDLAAGNGFSANVSVLLNDGDGTFATKVNYTVDDTSFAVATGDLDDDGYDDIVVVNHESDVVSVLINDGDGTFGSNTDYAVGDTPESVTTADFNWDGYLDIAVANYEDDDVSVLLGNGDGTFGTKTDYSVGSYPIGIVAGDFNGDNKTDLAVSNSYSNTVSVLLNTSTGSSNAAPSVDAGLDDIVTYPANATLDATVTDDDLPDPPATVTTTWTKQSGPGTVTFGNASAVDTTAAFSASGTYVLRLTADDSDETDYDDVTITVNAAPSVNAGLDDSVIYPSSATLDATVTDDGLPASPGTVTTTWSMTSGPGTVTFGNASAVDTTAAFSTTGTYVLRLTADDGDTTAYDEVQITVNTSGGNSSPTVNAGLDDAVNLSDGATLDATVTDDGLPDPPASVTTTWTKQSGPGTVTFGNSSAVDTTAAFDTVGTYVLRLTADDNDLTAYDEVTVTVFADSVFILPCKIEAEDYRDGGEGVGYHDSASGPGVYACDDEGGGYAVRLITPNEWLAYDVYVPETSMYTFTFRVYADGRYLYATLDDEDVTGTVETNLPGDWADIVVSNVSLTAGSHVLKIVFPVDWNWAEAINYLDVSGTTPPEVNAGPDWEITLPNNSVSLDATVTDDGNPDPPAEFITRWTLLGSPGDGVAVFGNWDAVDTTVTFDTAGVYVLQLVADDSEAIGFDTCSVTVNAATTCFDLPGRLEAEDYSDQGEGISYHDTTSGNAGSVYRSDDVDIESCTDSGGGYDVYTIADDEWLVFCVDVSADTTCYDIVARVNSSTSSRQMHIEVDDVDVTGAMTFDSTGGWTDVTAESIHLSPGRHVIKVVMDTGDFKLNYVDFLAESYEEYIVENGVANADIVISSDPKRSVVLAADELQDIIYEITGATLPIVSTETAADVHIYVGQSSYTDSLGISTAGLEHDAFKMVSGSDWMALIGADTDFVRTEPNEDDEDGRAAWDAITGSTYLVPPIGNFYRDYNEGLDIWQCDGCGSLQAVYEFLRNIGCRWFYPDEIGQVLPDLDDIGLPAVNRTVEPDYPHRNILFWYREFSFCDDDEIKWQLRMGLNSSADNKGWVQTHGTGYVIGREEMKVAHPEYYVLNDGVRETVGWKGEGWPCFSSSGLMAETINFAENVYDHYGDPMVSVTATDGYDTMCECELCVGKDTPERGTAGRFSDYGHHFANEVAKELYLTHPSKKVGLGAYGHFLLPPLEIEEFSPNVVVSYAWMEYEITTETEYQDYLDRVGDWLRLLPSGAQIIIRGYLLESLPTTDAGNPQYFTQLNRNRFRMYKDECLGYGCEAAIVRLGVDCLAADHLNIYVTGRLLWDCERDLDAMLNDYYEKFYGPAAQEMKAFVEYVEENHPYFHTDSNVITTERTLLNAAITAASGSGIYADRVDLMNMFLQIAENEAPSVDAGSDQNVTLTNGATLDATVTDDGLPNPPATCTVLWTKTSGPGTVTFGNATAVDTTAAFSTAGTYVLSLTADDTYDEAYDEVTITVSE